MSSTPTYGFKIKPEYTMPPCIVKGSVDFMNYTVPLEPSQDDRERCMFLVSHPDTPRGLRAFVQARFDQVYAKKHVNVTCADEASGERSVESLSKA